MNAFLIEAISQLGSVKQVDHTVEGDSQPGGVNHAESHSFFVKLGLHIIESGSLLSNSGAEILVEFDPVPSVGHLPVFLGPFQNLLLLNVAMETDNYGPRALAGSGSQVAMCAIELRAGVR